MAEIAPLSPAGLDRVVRACLAKDPDERWQNAHDVALALAGCSEEAATAGAAAGGAPVERQFALTAAHVRQLTERNPRLVGHPVTFVDNQVESDTLLVFLHGVGADGGRFEGVLRAARHRAVAVTLVGFGRTEGHRPSLSLDDHSRVLRLLLADLVAECRPRRT